MNKLIKKSLKINKTYSKNLKGKILLKKSNKENKIDLIYFKLNIISLIFALVLVISIINLSDWYFNNENSNQMISTVSEFVDYNEESLENSENNEELDLSINFEKLKSINETCFAWLVVDGTNINYPIVKYSNNDYYINHSFDNSNNSAGWIFADYRNKCDGTDKNLVIYGHNRKNNTMFSTLITVLKEDWYNNKENLLIKLYTPEGLVQYQVFSVYEVRAESYYTLNAFASDESYLNFLNTIQNRSIHNFNIDLTNQDSILTLSTCSNNSAFRTVLHAKFIEKTPN